MAFKNNAKIIISAEDKTKQAFDQIKTRLTSISVLSGAGLLAAGAGIFAMAKQTAAFNDEMIKSAQSAGTNTEKLSGLAYGAKLAGVEFEQLNVGLVKLAKSREDFSDGLSTSIDAFNKIDLDPTKFKDTSDLFDAVAEKLSKLPDGAQKSAIAMALLGKSGAKLIPLMNGGADAIKSAREEAEKFGLIVSSETARQSEQFNDNLSRMEASLKGLRQTIGNEAIPGLVEITDNIVETTKQSNLLYGVLVGLGTAFKIAFNGDEETRRAARIKELSTFISYQSQQLANFGKGSNTEVIDNLKNKIKDARDEMRKLIIEQSAPYNKDKSLPKIELPEIVSKSAETAAKKQADALAKLTAEFEKAVKPTQTQSEALQETLDTYGKLDPKVRAYLQGLVDQVAATEQLTKAQADWNELADLQRTSDDESLRQLEEMSAAEEDRKAAMEASAQAIRELYDPSLKLLNIQAEYQQLLNDGLISQEEYTYALEKAAESQDDFAKKGKDSFDELKRAIEGVTNDTRETFLDWAFDNEVTVSDMVKSMLKSLARLTLQQAVFDPLVSYGSGVIKDILPKFGGARAIGGSVSSDKAYLVGEKGPELLVGGSGTIIPNHMLGGGNNVQVNVQVDSTGGNVQSDSNFGKSIGNAIKAAVQSELINQKRQGGILA
jgi:ferritin-like metal-binding protein YciE